MIDFCKGLPDLAFEAGDIILREGEQTGILYILIDGCVEITKQGITLNEVSETGAIFGEVSWLLNTPHIATVKAVKHSRFHIVDDAKSFIRSNPDVGLKVAAVLAQRLSSVTNHLTSVRHSLDCLMTRQTSHWQLNDNKLPRLTHGVANDGPLMKALSAAPFPRRYISS